MKSSNFSFQSFIFIGFLFLSSCSSKSAPDKLDSSSSLNTSSEKNISLNSGFNDYWYAGEAEISSYELTQARYGELHPGTEVLIFVTEDYNMDKQVKKESPSNDAFAPILKLNRIKRFTTGIYDYSMMTSVFKAVDFNKYPRAFKINSSSQDWCGHTWSTLTWGDNGYRQNLDSYFESEVVEDRDVSKVISEDELMTIARLSPDLLPQGKYRMIPSLNYSRFSHIPLSAEECSGDLTTESDKEGIGVSTYSVKYTSGRELKIVFQTEFPHKIYSWEEKRKSGFGTKAKWLTTTAKLKKSIKSAYWSKNGVVDEPMRKLLGL